VFYNGFVLSVQPAVTEAFHIPSWKLSRVGTHILSRTMKSLPHIHSKIRIFTTTVSSVNQCEILRRFCSQICCHHRISLLGMMVIIVVSESMT
jgi:hypothetical protein